MNIKKDDLLQLRNKLQIEVKDAFQEQRKWIDELNKRQKTLASVEQLLEAMFGEQIEPEPAIKESPLPTQPSFVALPQEYKKATDMAFKLLKETSHPLSLDVIVAKLKERGKEIKKNSLWSMLYRDNRFKKVGRGLFGLSNTQKIEEDVTE